MSSQYKGDSLKKKKKKYIVIAVEIFFLNLHPSPTAQMWMWYLTAVVLIRIVHTVLHTVTMVFDWDTLTILTGELV